MRTIVFVDAGQFRQSILAQRLQLKQGEKFDWAKFKDFLKQHSDNLMDIYYFDAKSNAQDTKHAFHSMLKNQLNFNLNFSILKDQKKTCNKCGNATVEYVQKGVDVQIATQLLTLGFNKAFDQAILCSGDGDFADVVKTLRNQLGHKILLACWTQSIAPSLRDVASHIIPLEQHKCELIATSDTLTIQQETENVSENKTQS